MDHPVIYAFIAYCAHVMINYAFFNFWAFILQSRCRLTRMISKKYIINLKKNDGRASEFYRIDEYSYVITAQTVARSYDYAYMHFIHRSINADVYWLVLFYCIYANADVFRFGWRDVLNEFIIICGCF